MDFITMYQFYENLNAFQTKISTIKQELLSSMIIGKKDLEEWQVNSFKANVKDLIYRYKDFSDKLSREMRATKLENCQGLMVIQYDLIKEIIYASPDYQSIIGYLVGMIRGVDDDTFSKQSEIDEFFTHTVDKAFPFNVESTGELLEKCQFMRENTDPMTKLDQKLFNSLVVYPDLFKMTDSSSIFISVSRSLDALIKYLENSRSDPRKNLQNIMVINSYFEYLKFTVVAYITRIYMITVYYYPIWNRVNDHGDMKTCAIREAAELEDRVSQMSNRFVPLTEFERSKVLDPNYMMQFIALYRQMIMYIGVGNIKGMPNNDREYSWDSDDARAAVKRVIDDAGLGDNIIVAKVIGSFSNYYDYQEQRAEVPVNITEIFHNLKSSLNNSKQALQLNGSAKDDILQAIAACGEVKSLADLRSLAANSFILTGGILVDLGYQLKRLVFINSDSAMNSCDATIGNSKMLAECHMMLLELYRDIAAACYDKAVLLEKLYQALSQKRMDDMEQSTKMNIDQLLSSGMTSQVPDTLRMSTDLLPKYQQPLLENYDFRNQYLRSLNEFHDDMYLTEAGAGDIVAALMSLIEGIAGTIAGFFKNFKPAADWVKRNVDPAKLAFDDGDKLDGISQYKIGSYSDFIKGLSLESVKANLNKLDEEFVASLYPSKEIYEWFKADKTAAAVRYRNRYLFGKDSDKPMPTVTLSGKDLLAGTKEWVDDVLSYDATMAALNETGKALQELVKYLRDNAVKTTSTAPKSATPGVNSAPDVKPVAGETNVTKQPDTKPGEVAKPDDKAQPAMNDRIARVQNAITNLWLPIYQGMLKAMRDEYGYIKRAHAISNQKSTGTTAPATADNKSGV